MRTFRTLPAVTRGAGRASAAAVATAVLTLAVALAPASVPAAAAAGEPAAERASSPAVDLAATPPGWLAVDDGNAQLSVPPSWALAAGAAATCGPQAGAVLLDGARWCPPGSGAAPSPSATVVTLRAGAVRAAGPLRTVNGIRVDAPGVADLLVAPAPGATVAATGPLAPTVLDTLTWSPRAVALAAGTAPPVPRGWRHVVADGVQLAVPADWPVQHLAHAPSCADGIALPEPGVVVARGPALPLPCPIPRSEIQPVPQVLGVEIDGGAPAPAGPCTWPRQLGGLSVCVEARPAYGILEVVARPGGRPTVTIQLGLAGRGVVDRTVLHSLTTAPPA